MNLDQITPECFIMSLFIRDDGQRFLLGDGAYTFKDNQQHFVANSYANDVVEVQGNDGVFLAGQVRRASSQSFDGYVGDATVSKPDIEEYRKDFLAFFRKNYYYTVVYIFPNGDVIQRRKGFIVDAPEVKELFQVFPEYHIALNFEDVNYYSYSEDPDGNEKYTKSATIYLSTGASSGGLVWDSYGAVSNNYTWITPVEIEGSEIEITNSAGASAPIESIQFKGDTDQQSAPSPASPQAVNTVTGRQVVTITDDDNQSQDYEINLGKNLLALDALSSGTTSAVAISYDNNTMSLNGTSSGANSFNALSSLGVTLPAGTYTTSAKIISGSWTYPSSPADADFAFYILDAPNVSSSHRIGSFTGRGVATWWGQKTFTLSEDTTLYFYGTFNSAGIAFSSLTIGLQIEAGSTATSYASHFTPIELCKIGDYQDYIYKSGDDWYIHKTINSLILGDNESPSDWYTVGSTQKVFAKRTRFGAYSTSTKWIISDKYLGVARNNIGTNTICLTNDGDIRFDTGTTYTDVNAFLSFLASNNVLAYYVLATPTDTQITNSALINQLDTLAGAELAVGENSIVVTAAGSNLPSILDLWYYTQIDYGGAGYEWEAGSGAGPTTVMVDSIDRVYPVWEITGPADNPQLAVLNTNTTIKYSGTITASQTLVIDMFNKTAKLNGTSVIGNVSGDWLYFDAGNNRVTYTTNNADANPSTIYWQEVVG